MRETLISESLIKAMFALCCVMRQFNGSPDENNQHRYFGLAHNFGRTEMYE